MRHCLSFRTRYFGIELRAYCPLVQLPTEKVIQLPFVNTLLIVYVPYVAWTFGSLPGVSTRTVSAHWKHALIACALSQS